MVRIKKDYLFRNFEFHKLVTLELTVKNELFSLTRDVRRVLEHDDLWFVG